MQRRGAIVLGLVDRCARIAHQLGAFQIPFLACDEQWRGAVVGGLVGISPGVAKQSGALGVALLACEKQWRVPTRVGSSDHRASSE